jgi:undecaprenyl-diphosphatase
VHWFTDVIAGWITGLAWLMLCVTVREVWRLTVGSVPSPLVPTVASGPAGPSDPPAGPPTGSSPV